MTAVPESPRKAGPSVQSGLQKACRVGGNTRASPLPGKSPAGVPGVGGHFCQEVQELTHCTDEGVESGRRGFPGLYRSQW